MIVDLRSDTENICLTFCLEIPSNLFKEVFCLAEEAPEDDK